MYDEAGGDKEPSDASDVLLTFSPTSEEPLGVPGCIHHIRLESKQETEGGEKHCCPLRQRDRSPLASITAYHLYRAYRLYTAL